MSRHQRLRRGRKRATPAPSSGFYPSITCRKTDLVSLSSRRVALQDEWQPSSTHKQKEARTRLAPGPRHHVSSLRESRVEEQGHAHLIYIACSDMCCRPASMAPTKSPLPISATGRRRRPDAISNPMRTTRNGAMWSGLGEAHFGEPSGTPHLTVAPSLTHSTCGQAEAWMPPAFTSTSPTEKSARTRGMTPPLRSRPTGHACAHCKQAH